LINLYLLILYDKIDLYLFINLFFHHIPHSWYNLNEIFNRYSKDLTIPLDMIFNHMLFHFLYLYFKKNLLKMEMSQVKFPSVSHLINKNLDLKVLSIFKAHLIDQNLFQKILVFLKHFIQASCFKKKLC